MEFSNGESLEDTLDGIRYGGISVSSIPEISVMKKDGKFYADGNRRLWLFKELEKEGILSTITVNIIDKIPKRKFTTTNDGLYVRIRHRN